MSLRSKIFVLNKPRNQMEIQQAESRRYHPNTTPTGGLAALTSDSGGGPSSLSNERLLSRHLSRCKFFLKKKQKQLLPDFPSSILSLFASDHLLFHSKPSKVAFRAPTPPWRLLINPPKRIKDNKVGGGGGSSRGEAGDWGGGGGVGVRATRAEEGGTARSASLRHSSSSARLTGPTLIPAGGIR